MPVDQSAAQVRRLAMAGLSTMAGVGDLPLRSSGAIGHVTDPLTTRSVTARTHYLWSGGLLPQRVDLASPSEGRSGSSSSCSGAACHPQVDRPSIMHGRLRAHESSPAGDPPARDRDPPGPEDFMAGRHVAHPLPVPQSLGRHPSWRWDEHEAKAFCTCIKRPHSIFDIVMHVEGVDFEAAKVRVAEILGRGDLIGTRRPDASTHDAAGLLQPRADQQNANLARAYLAHRLGVPPDQVAMPSTPVVGWRVLPYYDPPPRGWQADAGWAPSLHRLWHYCAGWSQARPSHLCRRRRRRQSRTWCRPGRTSA